MKPAIGWAAISTVLLETASRDLTSVEGAFSLSASEWQVLCFIAGVIAAAVAAWKAPGAIS